MSRLAPPTVVQVLNSAVPQAVRDALSDPDRLTPMLAGASCIRMAHGQGMLVVRRAAADVEVRAPKALLDRVFALCDGTRTVNEVLARVPTEEARAEFGEFMAFLLEQGALIDANLACAQAVRYGFQFSPFGLAAPGLLTHQVATRFLWNTEGATQTLPEGTVPVPGAPLDAFFEKRVTQYTFDDQSISADTLHAWLWSVAGVVKAQHPRGGAQMPQRTLGSAGGMHLLSVFVALRRPVGAYRPGVYQVVYPGERLIALRLVNTDIDRLPLAFSKPWQLTFATGAIFLAADPAVGAMRYRNRSLQYLFMEAGAALHNAALSANALGLGQATLGGYYEHPVAALCQLAPEMLVLGSAVFGARASAQQIADQARSPDVDFAWVHGDSPLFPMRFHMARAKLKSEHDDRPHTWGRDTDPVLAMRKAVAEAIEREGYKQPRGIFQARLAELPAAVDPTQCVLYSPKQYAAPGFPFHRFDAARPQAWTSGLDLATGQEVHLLAELVFSHPSLAAQGHDVSRPVTQVTSSGCAAGVDVPDATERALREVIERDAFMRHWLAQTPGEVVPAHAWPAAIRQRLQAMQDTGCRVQLQRLATPWLHVAMVSVQHPTRHFTTLGMSAHAHFTRATEGALDETEARVYAWLHGHQPHIREPKQVLTPEHHFELYGLKPHFRRADRVLFAAEPSSSGSAWPRAMKARSLEGLTRQLARAGLRTLAVNITPTQHHVDQGRTPLSVVKVVVPSLLPISFGFQKEPMGMVARVHPGAHRPHPFP
ncbi:MAG: YcaO-like family protein [Pseudomonadota bacterium]